MKRIAVIPGDGIGTDVINEALKVIEAVQTRKPMDIQLTTMDYGAEKYLKTKVTMPEEQYDDFRNNYHAILMGAFGDPRVPGNEHAKDILLGTRFKLDLYVNFRPVKLLDERFCPLKNKTVHDVNFTVFRENTEGLYVSVGGIFKKNTPDEIAIQEEVNTRKGVERIIRYAFEFAAKNGHKKVAMADKSNAMTYGHNLWYRCFFEVAKEYPQIQAKHFYIDALAMMMIREPEMFEVIVTNNLFGDIITDIGAQLQGGMGLAASGNINPNGVSMFEPVHGSAPDIAGKDIANPVASILTAEMMLRHLGFTAQADMIDRAVRVAIQKNKLTKELGGSEGTKACGSFIAEVIRAEN
ncbi:MAG TPA: 3-isopropylmalate dehydrogenase [bacterium]|nr:3-isopropylmalate dehydrogenase [bacterium]HMW32044.1 3-isopropylmalate dehydrogenase [bacterium]HMW34782.1 3-isopropylmalate dehydrogenase [bacterium]HMY34492.1 3-isopropylmalate dehydrogenase [bacterium]HMZ03365.1 3-isopropylmalate dehydrogenase [bacterium]